MIKKLICSILIVTVLITATACTNGNSDNNGGQNTETNMTEYQKIDAKQAKEMIDSNQDIIILDVRTPEEYKEKHIPDAVLVPNDEITDKTIDELPLDATILVYCRSGNRSKQAAQKLIQIGYTNVYDFGGINEWPYETEKGAYQDANSQKSGEFSKFTAVDLNNNEVNQDILKGHKLTVLNVWGTFCGPCISEMPDLGELSVEYKDKGVQIVGAVIDTTDIEGKVNEDLVESAKEIVKKTGANYLHLIPSQDLIDIKLKDVYSIPETIFIDEDGNIIASIVGSRSKEEWTKILDDMLEKVK